MLCYSGVLLYEAKCLNRRMLHDGLSEYFIHYKGWSKKWDEWVEDTRLYETNDINTRKMAVLKEN